MNTFKHRLQQTAGHRFFYPALVVLFVLCANGLYLTNHYVANPAYLRSGLINGIKQGPFLGQYTIDPSDGFYAQALGHRAAVDLAHGNIPWWNHYEGIGAPLIGGLQSAALFPLEFLLVFPNGLFYFHLVLEIIAGIGTYYFLRRLKCNQAASVLGGAAFAVNGTFAWIAHTIFNPIAFLPFLMLGVELILSASQDGKRRGWLLLALAISCTLYSGFPETGFICMMFASLWAIARMNNLPRAAFRPYIAKLAMGLLAGIALASPLLLAFVEYLPHANVGLHAGNTSNLVLPVIGLSGLILPYIYGPIFANWGYDTTLTLYKWWAVVGGFLSISLLPIAIMGLFARGFRRIDRLFLLAWILFCVLASYGLLGVNQIAGHIPILSTAAFSRYFPPAYEFAVIVLMAMGITYLWDHTRENKRILRIIGIATAVCLILVAGAVIIGLSEYHRLPGAPYIRKFYVGSILWGLSVVLGLGLAMVLSRRKVARACILAIVLLDVGAMYVIPMLSAPRYATIDLKPVVFLRQNLGTQRMFSLGPIQPNYGSYYRVASVNVNDVPQPRTYSKYITDHLDSNVNAITFTGTNSTDGKLIQPPEAFLRNMKSYEAIGVKYVITFPKLFTSSEIQKADLKLVFKDEISEIYLLPNPKPYVSTLSGACTTTAIGWDEISADCSKPSTLLRLAQSFPGWSASVDGSSVPVGSHQDLLQTVAVPKGKHTVRFSYEPPYIKWTYALVVATLALIIFQYRASLMPYARRLRRIMDSAHDE